MKTMPIPEQSWPADAVSRVPTASLIPYARNARTHSDAQVAQIAASIREWGWTTPVLVDEEGTLIAGHGRLLAAQVLGLPDVPVMVAKGWSEAKRRAYAIADNRLALNAGWDEAMLALEVSALDAEGFDLDLLGFDPEELSDLLLGVDPLDSMPPLPDGDKAPFQQMTFTLHDTQAETVGEAIAQAKTVGTFDGSPNENSNGNALHRICEAYLSAHA